MPHLRCGVTWFPASTGLSRIAGVGACCPALSLPGLVNNREATGGPSGCSGSANWPQNVLRTVVDCEREGCDRGINTRCDHNTLTRGHWHAL
eukprot:2595798-Rhodomonas_salina.3